MLSPERLLLAIDIHSRSYKLLRWIGAAIENGLLPLARAEQHSDTPDAAIEWITKNYQLFPCELMPGESHLREFACFFWTYVTSSFDVVAYPGTLLQPGNCGCMYPLCARIKRASHLQPKKLSKADKRRALELMMDRISALAEEERVSVTPERCGEIASDPLTRRSAGFSTYGYWLINRLTGRTDGPAILALWREIAWNKSGSPIQGFSLRYEEFENDERLLLHAIGNPSESPDAAD
jgi:hypothetical protein